MVFLLLVELPRPGVSKLTPVSQSNPLPLPINKVLLGHRHVHSFAYIACGGFHTARAGLSSCNWDLTARDLSKCTSSKIKISSLLCVSLLPSEWHANTLAWYNKPCQTWWLLALQSCRSWRFRRLEWRKLTFASHWVMLSTVLGASCLYWSWYVSYKLCAYLFILDLGLIMFIAILWYIFQKRVSTISVPSKVQTNFFLIDHNLCFSISRLWAIFPVATTF